MQQESPPSQAAVHPHGTEVQVLINKVLAARKFSSALPEAKARHTPNSLSGSTPLSGTDEERTTSSFSVTPPSLGASTSEVSDGVPPTILDSPEEGKGFRSSGEINVKKLVGDAVGNVNLLLHVERSRNLMRTTSLDEYQSYFARRRSCSVCCSTSALSCVSYVPLIM